MCTSSSRNRLPFFLIKLVVARYKSPNGYSTHFIHTNEDGLARVVVVVEIIYSAVGKIPSGLRPPADFAHSFSKP